MEAHTFDNEFSELLLRTLLSEQPATDLNHLTSINKQTIKSASYRSLIYKLNRWVLIWLSDLHRVDLLKRVRSNSWHELEAESSAICRPGRKTERKWPRVFLVVFLMCSLVLIFKTYHQNVHDANLVRLQKLQSYLNNSNGGRNSQQIEHLQSAISEARSTLKSIGAAHIQWTFKIQCITIFFLKFELLWLILFPLIYGRNDGLVFLSPRVLLDREDECRVRAEMIIHELNKLVACSLSFCKTKLAEISHDHSVLAYCTKSCNRLIGRQYNSSLHERIIMNLAEDYSKRHQLTIGLLKRVALDGRLNALSQSRAHRDKLNVIAFKIIILTPVSYFSGPVVFYWCLCHYLKSEGESVELENWRDLSDLSLFFAYFVFLPILTILFVTVTFAVTLVDHTNAIHLLRGMIKNVITENYRRLGDMSTLVDAINRTVTMSMRGNGQKDYAKIAQASSLGQSVDFDLMTIIIQWRLLAANIQIISKQLSLFATFFLSTAASMTVILRIHGVYFNAQLRFTCTVLSVGFTLWLYIYMIPMGLLHRRMISTFELLWSLTASVSRLESEGKIEKYLQADRSIALITLRRELADSSLQMRQFACRVLNVPVTYANLIKVAFWALLLALPLADGSVAGFSMGFLSDPFGLASSVW